MKKISGILNINPELESEIFKKGTILQRAGDETSHIFYVKKGLLKSYKVDDTGKEHIFMFAPENWIISDMVSMEENHSCELFIECIEKTELIKLNTKFFNPINSSKEQLAEQVNLLYKRVAVLQNRVIMLMSASAQNRYEYFLESYPELPNRIPQHMIASFLGITPQALSNIRRKISKNRIIIF